MCKALLCGDDSSHSQGQSGKRLLLASRGISGSDAQVHGSCIDPTHLSHTLNLILKAPRARCLAAIRLLKKDYAAGNDFMQVLTNLCYRECFCKTNCWQELHFEFSRQKFEQECAKPFYVVMTHHTAKANLEKGSSWPPEAFLEVTHKSTGLVLTQPICPTP